MTCHAFNYSEGNPSGSDVWLCLICGLSGCGQFSHNHIKQHYLETLHTHAINTEARQVWDFVADVHARELSRYTRFTSHSMVESGLFLIYISVGYDVLQGSNNNFT